MRKTYYFPLTFTLYSRIVAICLVIAFYGCRTNDGGENVTPQSLSKSTSSYNNDVAIKWAEMDLRLVRASPGFTPPVAARALGYAGVTLYESVVHGMASNQSLETQLNGLNTLPKPATDKEYNWAISANTAQWYMAKNLWPNANAKTKTLVDSLGNALLNSLKAGVADDIVSRSTAYGEELAKAIFEWSKTDGGHEGFSRNFPADYKVPIFPGSWQPTENGIKIPLQPYWGKNRTFLVRNGIMTILPPLVISTDPNSNYFKQYMTVYKKNISLTQEEKEISIWWADDPSETFTPPGHSYNLARIAALKSAAKLDKAAEAFARVGLAVADAFIMCWKCKYSFNNERPYTFVRRAIDPNWIPFWPAPPFPGYTSGHATQSAATAIVLEDIFGKDFAFTDDSHVGRLRDQKRNTDFKARSYKSFWEAAQESAYSRFLGGIHTMQDNETGLQEGKKLGANINSLNWKK